MLKVSFLSKGTMPATALALALAVLSTTSVFAAPANVSSSAVANSNSVERIWGGQFRELQTDRAIFDKIKSHPGQFNSSSKPAEFQRFLDQYAFALKQAEAIIAHGSPSSSADLKVNNRFEKSLTSQQELATYLHMMHGLQMKLGGM